jgi:hypothetical protein
MNELEHAKQLSDESLISKLSRCVREDPHSTLDFSHTLAKWIIAACIAIKDSTRCSTTAEKIGRRGRGTRASSKKRGEEHLSKEPVDSVLSCPQEDEQTLAKRDEATQTVATSRARCDARCTRVTVDSAAS